MADTDKKRSNKELSDQYKKKYGSLPECVTESVEEYFRHLDQCETRGFYALVMQQVEAPLLEVVMRKTLQNQSAAAELLGLNRGTLRKKLKQYGLLE